MTHYQKLAAILIRFFCLIGILVEIVRISESLIFWKIENYFEHIIRYAIPA